MGCVHQATIMKSGLAWGSFLCIICLYWRRFGGGDGGYASPLVMAPAPTSGLIRLRSGHHYEVRLGMGIIFMYNMSILEACLGRHFFRGLHAQKKKRSASI